MAQVKIYGLRSHLDKIKTELSEVIHSCLVDSFSFPPDKKFQRYIGLEADDFIYPGDRSGKYIIIEFSIFEGRKKETKKKLIKNLIENIKDKIKIDPEDIEITIFETPKENWGIRGHTGDELKLTYKVNT